ncbi:hypothetical protein HK102_006017 [Quaeritorhiza haematococci]|nr:hypothetical protein HK102_006017 [Quaeritorhiza haematococci]
MDQILERLVSLEQQLVSTTQVITERLLSILAKLDTSTPHEGGLAVIRKDVRTLVTLLQPNTTTNSLESGYCDHEQITDQGNAKPDVPTSTAAFSLPDSASNPQPSGLRSAPRQYPPQKAQISTQLTSPQH